jgi:hypothetical protein
LKFFALEASKSYLEDFYLLNSWDFLLGSWKRLVTLTVAYSPITSICFLHKGFCNILTVETTEDQTYLHVRCL